VLRAPDGSVHIGGKVITYDRPRKLAVTFNVNWPGLVEALGETLVTYDIEQSGDSVRLTMTEANERKIDEDILSGGRAGWPAILSSLKSVLETGKPLVVKMEPPVKMLECAEEARREGAGDVTIRHCERSEAIHLDTSRGLLRRKCSPQ
jgi:hypothetical protein